MSFISLGRMGLLAARWAVEVAHSFFVFTVGHGGNRTSRTTILRRSVCPLLVAIFIPCWRQIPNLTKTSNTLIYVSHHVPTIGSLVTFVALKRKIRKGSLCEKQQMQNELIWKKNDLALVFSVSKWDLSMRNISVKESPPVVIEILGLQKLKKNRKMLGFCGLIAICLSPCTSRNFSGPWRQGLKTEFREKQQK